jgi:RimJ/RimL family protein N-acetyltransferase
MAERSEPRDQGEHSVVVNGDVIQTPRLTLRPWQVEDAAAALTIFGDVEITRWMTPALDTVASLTDMQAVLTRWRTEADSLDFPQGRWAIVETATDQLVGGAALLLLPPFDVDLVVAWHLAKEHWGHGYATEAGHAVAHQAFLRGEDEIFAVVRPNNKRAAATAQRAGMEWVGETSKYYDLRLNVYRLRSADLDAEATSRGECTRDPTHGSSG